MVHQMLLILVVEGRFVRYCEQYGGADLNLVGLTYQEATKILMENRWKFQQEVLHPVTGELARRVFTIDLH